MTAFCKIFLPETNLQILQENSDPFYSEINQSHLMKAIQQLKEGKGVAHKLIEE